MNRAQMVQAIAACDALAAELRKSLKADAAAEFAEQGCAPTWRLPGFTVSTSVTRDSVVIADEKAFAAYVAERFPTEVETIVRVRPAFQEKLLAEVVKRGDPPCDGDGREIPGLAFVSGGEFRSVAVQPSSETRSSLRAVAAEIASGRRPLALPSTAEVA